MIWSAFRSAALLLLLIAATGCTEKSSPLVERPELTVKSGDRVRVAAAEGADEYTWRGLEGTDGISFNTKGRILEFTAPAVQKRHTALFEIEAEFRLFTQNQNVKVVIEPSADDNNDTSRENNASTEDKAVVKSLALHVERTSLNRDRNTTVTLTAKYKDNTEKTVTEGITWIITPKGAVKIEGSTLTALEDGNVTVRAKAGGLLSNTVKLNIYWEVDGHRLPPEPDPKINNATLLGVDVNHNGVRDDVERKVYATYKKAIERAVMMQAFRTEQAMLADPDLVKNAEEWAKKEDKSLNCRRYLYLYKNQKRIKKMAQIIDNWQYNTEKRVKIYFKFDRALSGGVYSLGTPTSDDCEFDIERILEMDR